MSNVTPEIPTISATISPTFAPNIGDVKKLVQRKFKENVEEVLDIFEAYQIEDDADVPRILALVVSKSGGTYGVFSMSVPQLPPHNSNELTIKQVFAVDASFQMKIRDNLVSSLNFELSCTDEEPTVFYYYTFNSSQRAPNFLTFQANVFAAKAATDTKKLELTDENSLSLNWINDYRKFGEMKQQLKRREHEYIVYKEFTVYCATWNVNNKSNYLGPLPEWLSACDRLPDIFAVALQELDTSARATALGEDRCDVLWIERMLNNIPSKNDYEEFKSVRLVGMMLTIIIRKDLRAHISYCQIKSITRGVLNALGNKGAVAVSLQLNEDKICFVNSHLAAHLRAVKDRNDDYAGIVQMLTFENGIKLEDHDHIFWIGDLNYRIDEQPGIYLPFDRYDLDSYQVLRRYDQLVNEMRHHNCFNGYQEGLITFRPTYKYDTGTDNYDSSEKQRIPAYCDRILWKGKHIKQLCYNSVMEIRESDHKPVYAIFKVQIKTMDVLKYKRIRDELLKLVDKHENDNKPHLIVDNKPVNFGIVRFNEQVNRDLNVSNDCPNLVEFKFNVNLKLGRICEKWIRVQPVTGILKTDTTNIIHISLKICKKNIREFLEKLSSTNINENSFDFDILVLNVVGGNHIFISITGEYKPSCFGLSVETLCRTDRPLCDYTQLQFKELLVNRSERFRATMPREIYLLIDYLFKKGSAARDVFKKSNFSSLNSKEFEAVRDWLDTWSDDVFPGTPQIAAEALIMLLELPQEPMLAPFVDELLKKNSCDAAMECISQLSSPKRNVFVHLTLFLREGIEKEYYDLHDVSSLFGSVLLRSNNVEDSTHLMLLILSSDMGAVSKASKENKSAIPSNTQPNGNTALSHDLL